jgi:multiple sugar transport system substrate-binding protein
MRTPVIARRTFLGQAAALAGMTALTACQLIQRQPAGEPAQAATEITFMNWDTVKDTPLEIAIQEFERQNPPYKVKVQPTPARYEDKMRTLLAAGTPPDVMRINDDYVRGYSVKNQLLDLTPYLKADNIRREDYFEFVFDFAKQPDGKYTAWSIGNQPRLIYYNVNAFKDAGVPLPPTEWTSKDWTWDDFLARAKKLTVEGQRWGALIYDDTGFEQTFAVNNGEEDGIYSKDGKKFTLANPKGAEAIQWAADLTCKHKVQPEWSLLRQEGANNMFVAGKIAMFFRTQGIIPYLRRNVKNFEWDVAPVPAKVKQMTEGSLIVFCIPKAAKNPDGGWRLLRFLGGPGGGKIFAETSYFIPAMKEPARLIKAGKEPPAHVELFVKAMEYQTTVNYTENTERARQIYRPELELVYTCKARADDILTKVRPLVEDALVGKY